jgi:hypothetical protein
MMLEPTVEEALYGMPQEDIDSLKERLAMLSRNMRAKGLETFRFRDYEIGEDLESGNLCIDTIKVTKRKILGQGEVEKVYRTFFLMIDRHGNMMVSKNKRDEIRNLSQALILEELAAI